jgi:hypothetical protein
MHSLLSVADCVSMVHEHPRYAANDYSGRYRVLTSMKPSFMLCRAPRCNRCAGPWGGIPGVARLTHMAQTVEDIVPAPLSQQCVFESPMWYEERELFIGTPFIDHYTAVHSQTKPH